MHDAVAVLTGIVLRPGLPDITFAMFTEITFALFALMVVLCKEAMDEFLLRPRVLKTRSMAVDTTFIVVVATYLLLFGVLGGDQFIYFQF